MSSQITDQGQIGYITGLYVEPSDLLGDNESQLNGDGEVLVTVTGAVDILPMLDPVTMTANVTGGSVVVVVGGTGQLLVVQGRMCDYIPQQTFTEAAPSTTQPRVDILCVQYNQQNTNGVSRNYQTPEGGDASTTVYTLAQGVTWEYVVGTPGAGQPSTPAGYELFAVIQVPANATGALSYTIEFETAQQLLTGASHNPVTSINNVDGAVDIVQGTGINVVTAGQNITISLAETVVTSLNTLTGALTLAPGSGISITPSGSTLTITNTAAATTVNGIGGAVTIANGSGISVTESGSTITITNTNATTVNGVSGAVVVTNGTGIAVGTAGSTITVTNTGVTSLNGLTGVLAVDSPDGSILVNTSGSNIQLEAVPSLSFVFTAPVVSTASGISISLVIPNIGSEWYFEFTYFMNAANTDGKITRSGGSVISDTGNSGAWLGAQNPLVIYAGLAPANQTLTVTAANQYSGGGSQSITAAFLIAKAWRYA